MKSMVKRDSLYSIEESSQNIDSQGKEDINEINPFKFEEKQEYDNLEFSLQVLDDLTSSNVISELFFVAILDALIFSRFLILIFFSR
jgi:hypothetical protein